MSRGSGRGSWGPKERVVQFVSPTQMQALDRYAIETLGIPSLALMENAGRAVADAARARVNAGGDVVVCCGRGNNGGDGMVVARHLSSRGTAVHVFLVGDSRALRGDAKVQYDILQRMAIPVAPVTDTPSVIRLGAGLAPCDLIIDALLGTGLRGPVSDRMREVIEAVNAAPAPVIAVDIPSGLCGETGAALGAAVQADVTVTFQLPKTGFQASAALDYTGDVEVVDIGIPLACCPPVAELAGS